MTEHNFPNPAEPTARQVVTVRGNLVHYWESGTAGEGWYLWARPRRGYSPEQLAAQLREQLNPVNTTGAPYIVRVDGHLVLWPSGTRGDGHHIIIRLSVRNLEAFTDVMHEALDGPTGRERFELLCLFAQLEGEPEALSRCAVFVQPPQPGGSSSPAAGDATAVCEGGQS